MGTATTFATLIANPESEKVFLVEVKLAEAIVNWSKTGGYTNVYQVTYLTDTITLADDSTETIRKVIADLQQNGSSYSSVGSIAACDGAASSYYHDTLNGILYAHTSDGTDPDSFTIVGFFWLYFATKGIVLNGTFYEPYVAEQGIPSLSQTIPSLHWGSAQIGIGSVQFLNGRGYFDQIAKKYVWHNKVIRILLGGDVLPYAEYTCVFTGKIVDPVFTEESFLISLRSSSFDLLRTLPVNHFWTSDYANLNPSCEGKSIPYYWGAYSAAQAPIVTCINSAYAASTYQFKICDHAIKSITQVYIEYGAGAGWQTIAHGNEDLANATFTINTASFVLGTSKLKVAFEGRYSGGILTEGAPEIVEDILTNICGYAASQLNSAAFTASKTISTCALNVPAESEITALSLIEKICQSDLAFFDEDGAGLLRYRTWEPTVTGTVSPLSDPWDYLADSLPSVTDDTTQLYYRALVGYSFLCSQQEHLYKEASNNDSRYKYGKNETLTFETYLRGASDATALAQRLNWLTRDPSPTLTISMKASQITKNLGDKLQVTLGRAPYATAGGFSSRVFELIGKHLSCFPLQVTLTARDLLNFSSNVGFWMDASAPTWTAATAQQRDDSGFWCDSAGRADAADENSKNISLWW